MRPIEVEVTQFFILFQRYFISGFFDDFVLCDERLVVFYSSAYPIFDGSVKNVN